MSKTSQAELFAKIDSAVAEFEAWQEENGFRQQNQDRPQLDVVVNMRQSLRAPELGRTAFASSAVMAPSG